MKWPWPGSRRSRAAWGAVAVAGSLAVSARWLEQWRPSPPDRSASFTFRVTSSRDSGPGSLREAILAADRAPKRARIMIAVERIVLETALPPLVNPEGVVLEAATAAVIDGTNLGGPVLDVAAPATVLAGIAVTGGGAGIVIRAPGVTLRKVTVRASDTGVLIGDGADDLRIEESAFAGNRVGVQLAASAGRMMLQHARFTDQQVAGIWAVSGTPSTSAPQIHVADSEFKHDAIGIVAVNVNTRLERNAFDDHRTAAVHASGGRASIIRNRMRAGRGFGIYAERLQSGHISGNEIARNCSGGMLLRDVGNTEILANELYQNGYGLVLMDGPQASPNNVANNLIADQVGDGLLLIGSSPIISHNQILRNRKAGLRFSSMPSQAGAVQMPRPLLTGNVVRDNGRDEPFYDEFVTAPNPAAPAGFADCGWRLGTPSMQPARAAGAP